MKNTKHSEYPSITKDYVMLNSEIEYDMRKWLQDKIEYEAMLHRVFGSSDLTKKGNKTTFAK